MSLAEDTTTLAPAAPLPLAPLGEAEAARMNTLLGVRREFAFPWAGKPARFRFTPVAEAPRAAGWLSVRLGDHSFDLGLPELPEPSSLGPSFAGIEFSELPEALLPGVLEAWLQEPAAALKRHGLEFTLETWRTDSPDEPAALGWTLGRGDADPFLAGTLHASTEGLSHLAGLATRISPSAAATADAVPLSLSVELARLPLAIEELRSLLPGDVLLLPSLRPTLPPAQFELRVADRRVGRAARDGTTFKISSMNASPEAKPAAAAPLRVDELPVQLAFDVGQLDITVGQLRTLGEGYTFELPERPENLVTLRANGREVGRGELVELGDKVGVRIVHWSLA